MKKFRDLLEAKKEIGIIDAMNVVWPKNKITEVDEDYYELWIPGKSKINPREIQKDFNSQGFLIPQDAPEGYPTVSYITAYNDGQWRCSVSLNKRTGKVKVETDK